MVKSLPAVREAWAQSLGQEDPQEKEMATHSSTPAWKIPWKEEPGRLQAMGWQQVGHDWTTSLQYKTCWNLFEPAFQNLLLFFLLYVPYSGTSSCHLFLAYSIQLTWCHWCSASMCCSMDVCMVMIPSDSVMTGTEVLSQPRTKNADGWSWPFDMYANCLWCSFLTGLEKKACAESVASATRRHVNLL